MDNVKRDYGWNTYGKQHTEICKELDMQETNSVYVVKDKTTGDVFSIGKILGRL